MDSITVVTLLYLLKAKRAIDQMYGLSYEDTRTCVVQSMLSYFKLVCIAAANATFNIGSKKNNVVIITLVLELFEIVGVPVSDTTRHWYGFRYVSDPPTFNQTLHHFCVFFFRFLPFPSFFQFPLSIHLARC